MGPGPGAERGRGGGTDCETRHAERRPRGQGTVAGGWMQNDVQRLLIGASPSATSEHVSTQMNKLAKFTRQ